MGDNFALFCASSAVALAVTLMMMNSFVMIAFHVVTAFRRSSNGGLHILEDAMNFCRVANILRSRCATRPDNVNEKATTGGTEETFSVKKNCNRNARVGPQGKHARHDHVALFSTAEAITRDLHKHVIFEDNFLIVLRSFLVDSAEAILFVVLPSADNDISIFIPIFTMTMFQIIDPLALVSSSTQTFCGHSLEHTDSLAQAFVPFTLVN